MPINHPFLFWAVCYLWFVSIASIIWSVTLFIMIPDILILTRMDLVFAVNLLSGIVMIPSNILLLTLLSKQQQVLMNSSICFCPLWTNIMWVILAQFVGAIVCIQGIRNCKINNKELLSSAMVYYRSNMRLKRFIDNVQWYFKCCGLKSYTDWLDHEWYDKVREFEWYTDPVSKAGIGGSDSVPSSCCKSGSCVTSYLSELGPYSIYSVGCGSSLYNAHITCLWIHFLIFVFTAVVEIIMLRLISKAVLPLYDTELLMPVKKNFPETSSTSRHVPCDSDEDECLCLYQTPLMKYTN